MKNLLLAFAVCVLPGLVGCGEQASSEVKASAAPPADLQTTVTESATIGPDGAILGAALTSFPTPQMSLAPLVIICSETTEYTTYTSSDFNRGDPVDLQTALDAPARYVVDARSDGTPDTTPSYIFDLSCASSNGKPLDREGARQLRAGIGKSDGSLRVVEQGQSIRDFQLAAENGLFLSGIYTSGSAQYTSRLEFHQQKLLAIEIDFGEYSDEGFSRISSVLGPKYGLLGATTEETETFNAGGAQCIGQASEDGIVTLSVTRSTNQTLKMRVTYALPGTLIDRGIARCKPAAVRNPVSPGKL